MITSISREQLISTGCLFAETVDKAFDKFESVVVSADDKQKMRVFMHRVFHYNTEKMYADFYYPVLQPEEQKRFRDGLSDGELSVFSEFEINKAQVYYRIDEPAMEFLFEITARNWLFSTFYVPDKKVIIWGNYNLDFPVFCEDPFTLKTYINIAKECGLECHL